MSRAVWKYTMPHPGLKMDILVPVGFKPLCAGMQEGLPVLWCEVDADAEKAQTTFDTLGTGWDIPDGFSYAGTIRDGALVWHVYWRLA